MQFFQFANAPAITPFAPAWSGVLAETQLDGVDWHALSQWILAHEKEIHIAAMVSDPAELPAYNGNGPNSLSSNYSRFNLLGKDHPQAQALRRQVFAKYCEFMAHTGVRRRRAWLHSWVNIHRGGESIPAHVHNAGPYCYLSGHVSVQCSDTSTIYLDPLNTLNQVIIHDSPNEVGKLSIFQQSIPHYTTPHNADTPRITVAFDILVDDDYGFYPVGHSSRETVLLFDDLKNF
jgi:hypothetical protein